MRLTGAGVHRGSRRCLVHSHAHVYWVSRGASFVAVAYALDVRELVAHMRPLAPYHAPFTVLVGGRRISALVGGPGARRVVSSRRTLDARRRVCHSPWCHRCCRAHTQPCPSSPQLPPPPVSRPPRSPHCPCFIASCSAAHLRSPRRAVPAALAAPRAGLSESRAGYGPAHRGRGCFPGVSYDRGLL